MKEWEGVMRLEEESANAICVANSMKENLMKTVSLSKIINEREKRVEEFKRLGSSKRRVVTNLANEMRLRIFFLETTFEHFQKKKAWVEIRFLRDICLCCKKMLKVFIEDKLRLQYVCIQPQKFSLISITRALLNEVGYGAFIIHFHCDTMDMSNVCLLYRVCQYVLPKVKAIGQPTLEDEETLKDVIEMQHR